MNEKCSFRVTSIILTMYSRNIAIALMDLDLWILINVRESAKKIVLLFNVIVQIIILLNLVIEEELADFASEAAGATVLETPNTASYYETKSPLSFFGIPICKPHYWTPRKVIQPWSEAGECWAFRGDRGNIKIQLAYPTLIEQVALEHVAALASLTGKIDSAPKEFRITILKPEGSMRSDKFVYNQYGPSSQIFHIKNDKLKETSVEILTLEILSNWGNPNYTCVYRFKVHGRISQ